MTRKQAEDHLLERAIEMARLTSDGHLTILKFTSNWRVGFFTPGDREDIDRFASGKTLLEALHAALLRQTAAWWREHADEKVA